MGKKRVGAVEGSRRGRCPPMLMGWGRPRTGGAGVALGRSSPLTAALPALSRRFALRTSPMPRTTRRSYARSVWAGPARFGALDAPWGRLFAWLPVGTRATRVALASAAAAGVGGAVRFAIARGLLARSRSVRAQSTSPETVVAAIVALAATLSPSWQLEAAAPAGGTLGAVLALAAGRRSCSPRNGPGGATNARSAGLWRSARRSRTSRSWGWKGSCSLLVYAGMIAPADRAASSSRNRCALRARSASRSESRRSCSPLRGGGPRSRWRWGRSRRPPAGRQRASRGSRGRSCGMIWRIASSLLAVAGAVIGVRAVRSVRRRRGAGGARMHGRARDAPRRPAGPTRYGAPVLASVAAAYALAGVAMLALVQVVSQARVPFARASASMILVLEAALPASSGGRARARAGPRIARRGRARRVGRSGVGEPCRRGRSSSFATEPSRRGSTKRESGRAPGRSRDRPALRSRRPRRDARALARSEAVDDLARSRRCSGQRKSGRCRRSRRSGRSSPRTIRRGTGRSRGTSCRWGCSPASSRSRAAGAIGGARSTTSPRAIRAPRSTFDLQPAGSPRAPSSRRRATDLRRPSTGIRSSWG